jgi:hypothetical protein
MSKETVRKVIDTTPPPAGKPALPAFVKVATYHPANGEETKLILQRYLLTKIETIISREEALAITTALVEHFRFTPDETEAYLLACQKNKCEHDWARTAGNTDSKGASAPDYQKCKHCGATKEL